jgi:hypothetical protein
MVTETILEWQPFERIITQDLIPIPVPDTYALIETHLVSTENGARLIQSFGKAKGPLLGRILYFLGAKTMVKQVQQDIEAFKKQIEEDLAVHRVDQEKVNPPAM